MDKKKEAGVRSSSFDRFAGACAVLTGVVGFLYAVAFVVLRNAAMSALCLLLVGLLSTAVLVALYTRLRDVEPAFALWALALGLMGALGTALHGGFDLASVVQPVAPAAVPADVPSQMDPRGLLTFGVSGAALFVVAWLIGREPTLPRLLSPVGYVSAVLLVALYLGRLIVFDPTSPLILVPAILNGFLVNPIWNIWLGLSLRSSAGEAVLRPRTA